MTYTREEIDWIEAEWAYHLHGRQAFLSREDFLQLQAWEGRGVPADTVVAAMEAHFARRARKARPRAFVALSHLEKDVETAMAYRKALDRADAPRASGLGWEAVREPLRSDPRARAAFEVWRRAQGAIPSPEAPGFLDAYDAERNAFRTLVDLATEALTAGMLEVDAQVAQRLAESRLAPGSRVFERARALHRARLVCEAWGIPCEA